MNDRIVIPGQRNRHRYDCGPRFDSDRDVAVGPIGLKDADNMFFERELIHVIPGLLQFEHSLITARNVLPVYNANDPTAETAEWRMIEELGEAEIVENYADDSPAATHRVGKLSNNVVPIRDHATWTIQDIRASAKVGRPVDATDVQAARTAMLRKENSLVLNGDTDHDILGLLSDTTKTKIPWDSAAQTIAAGTPDQNLDVFGDANDATISATNEHHKPDVMLVAPKVLRHIRRQMRSATSDTTVYSLLGSQLPNLRIVEMPELNGAGTSGTHMAVMFKRDITVMRIMAMLDIEQFAPERKGLSVKVELHMRSGGLLVQRPKAIRVIDGL